jgi:uncharacterized phiE125 gp8 family phage protein
MTIALDPKRPDEVRDYIHDWSPFLGGDQISTVTTTGTDVTIADADVLSGNQSVKFWVSGGTSGITGRIVQSIVTVGGREETEIFTLPVRSAEEPVSVAEAKDHLNIVDDETKDVLIASYIRSARAFVESESGCIFVRRQFVESFNRWTKYLSLSRRPLISVDGVDYTDLSGVPQTVNSADYYTMLGLRRIAPVSTWPHLGNGGAISVRYTAGFLEGEQVAELELGRQAILLLVAHWFENRETVSIGNTVTTEVPYAVRALVDQFRLMVC